MKRPPYTNGIKKFIVLYILCMIVLECLALYFPMLLQDVTKVAEKQFDGGSVMPLVWQGLLVLGFITLIFAMQFICEWVGAIYASKYQSNIRSAIYDKFSRLSQDQIDQIGVARILPIMLNDTNWLKNLNRRMIILLVYFPVAILGSFVMLFNLSWVYALFAIGSLPILILFFWWNTHRIAKLIPDSVTMYDEYFLSVKEGIKGAKEIRTLGKAEERNQEFARYVNANRQQTFITNRAHALSTGFNAILFTAITIAIIIYGASTSTDVNDIVILNTSIQYINKIWAGSHQIFVWFVDHIPRCLFTSERMQKYYDMPEEPRPEGFESVPSFKSNRIRVNDVSYLNATSGRKELHNVSLDIEHGTCVTLAGMTSSGKSVLKNVLMKSIEPTVGEITFNDIDISQINTNVWRRDFISFCDSSPQFIPGTVRGNFQLLAPGVSDEEILQAFRNIGAGEFVKNFKGILDFEITENTNLSGGMQNVLNIIRCILKPAHLYIFNQCFEHIKDEYIVKLTNFLKREGKTALFITYSHTVCVQSDIIHVMSNGTIIASGEHNELIKSCPEYASLDVSVVGQVVDELDVTEQPEDVGASADMGIATVEDTRPAISTEAPT